VRTSLFGSGDDRGSDLGDGKVGAGNESRIGSRGVAGKGLRGRGLWTKVIAEAVIRATRAAAMCKGL
jgi:hypothetical protein